MDSARLDLGEVTRLLQSARDGEPAALERLISLLYEDLRRLARRQLDREYGERTLNATRITQDEIMATSNRCMNPTRGPCVCTKSSDSTPPEKITNQSKIDRH